MNKLRIDPTSTNRQKSSARRSLSFSTLPALSALTLAVQLAGCASRPVEAPFPKALADGCPIPTETRVWATSAGSFIWPADGEVLARFGARADGSRMDGIDIAAGPCAPVRAAAAGRIAYAGGDVQGLGKVVLIQHDDGLVTVYAHNRDLLVTRTERVPQGQPIALAGDAPVQFQVRIASEPVDPLAYLANRSIVMASNEAGSASTPAAP